jgi:mRNA interferase MazF
VWTAAGGPHYAAKPRPVVILQDDRFDATGSVTVAPLTSDPTRADLFRVPIAPTAENGLRFPSQVMADKITTMTRARVSTRLGRLTREDMTRLDRAVLVFLGLAGGRQD